MNFTDIVILLDRSESMRATAAKTRESLNGFIADQQKQEGEARLSLVQFAGPADYTYSYRDHPIQAVNGLTPFTYDPTGGSTALRDAMLKLINERGQVYSGLRPETRPSRIVFVVLTDGLDNASRVTHSQLHEAVTRQARDYAWEFIYLGAGHDAIAVAKEYGFELNKTLDFSLNNLVYTSSLLSDKVSNLRASASYTTSFSDDERIKAKS